MEDLKSAALVYTRFTVMSDSFTRFPVSVLERRCVYLVVHLFSLFRFFCVFCDPTTLRYSKRAPFLSCANTHLRSDTFHLKGELRERLFLETFPTYSCLGLDEAVLITSARFVEEVVSVTRLVDPSSEEKGMFALPCCFKRSPYAG